MNRARPTPAVAATPLKLALLNDWQRDFPLEADPFSIIAQRNAVSTTTVLAGYQQLADEGALSRIGGVWAAGAGGAAVLCAMCVPSHRLTAVAHQVSAHPGVNHNYEREHLFNLWFVMTGRNALAVELGVAALERATGLDALRLPMRQVYRIDLGFDLNGAAPATQPASMPTDPASAAPAVTEDDAELAALVEAGLPLVAQPYAQWAQDLGRSSQSILQTVRHWVRQGTLRRFGVVVRHHEVGFDQNAMTVFDVPDAQVDACGEALARQSGVTLCYQRARAPGWPYNLYCMVHGRERSAVEGQITLAIARCGLESHPHAVLFSRQRFKQAGARYFRTLPAEVPHVAH